MATTTRSKAITRGFSPKPVQAAWKKSPGFIVIRGGSANASEPTKIQKKRVSTRTRG